jgi:hypothetical protein
MLYWSKKEYLIFLEPKAYGIWAEVCGGTYLFGNKIVIKNIKICKIIKMENAGELD